MRTRALVLLLLPILVVAAQGQRWRDRQKQKQAAVGDSSVYFTTYFSNANNPNASDGTVRVINDGESNADLWAAYYVFDDSQELSECCACQVSPDGVNSESVNSELTANPLTGVFLKVGAIKVISSSSSDPRSLTPTPGLRAWATHVEADVSGFYATTETQLAASNLSSGEQTLLQELCYYLHILGSGHGTCSCTPEDFDF